MSNNTKDVFKQPFTAISNHFVLVVNGYLAISVAFSYTTTFGWVIQSAAFYNVFILLVFDAYGVIHVDAAKDHSTPPPNIDTLCDVVKALKSYFIHTRPVCQSILMLGTFVSSVFVMGVSFGAFYFDCNSWGSIIKIDTSSHSMQSTEIYFNSVIKPLGVWSYTMTEPKFHPALPAPMKNFTSIEIGEQWFIAQYHWPTNSSSHASISSFTTTMQSKLCTQSFIYIKPCYLIKNRFYYQNHQIDSKTHTKKEPINPSVNIFALLLLFPTTYAICRHLCDDIHDYFSIKHRASPTSGNAAFLQL